MSFKFEKLDLWHDALQLSNKIDLLVRAFPVSERYNLSNQLKRAADSIVLNIAEGSTGQSNPEYCRFLNMALRSAIEVVAALFISKTRGYVMEETYNELYYGFEELVKKITALRNYLRKH